ncbi:hypothetical protein EDD37DRAFT_697108 [Exophiala viscosa]|uniref:Transcription factor domain-containing protein n=1 Tax=Exophiala viscosa TaxID=2486360 RepID=A0AAN6I991_9EURO|nr:hypothetical protein EDD36DRAFT_80012 [Exophiala viscosa]KAI1620773.1 hypothetical protein EDD37DRAFT_697108 [Exophiala viscosa]
MGELALLEDDFRDFHEAQVLESLENFQRQIPVRTSPSYHQQFEFVEGLNSRTERKKTRSFVTRQHYRRKRCVKNEKPQKTNDKSSRCSTTASLRASGTSRLGCEQEVLSEDQDRTQLEALISFSSGRPPLSPKVITRLGGGRVDPFSSYPVSATRDVHELVDHYYFVIPSLVHRHWHRAVRKPRACWDLFNLYRKHEIPFLGMLHHAALHLATLRGQREPLRTIELRQRALMAVNEGLQRLNGLCDDWTLLGIGLLANAERVWGSRETARLHWGAVKRLLLERGGFRTLQHNQPMHTKLVWSFIALSWPTIDGNPAYLDEYSDSVAVSSGWPTSPSNTAFTRSCEEFVQFLNQRKGQSLKNLPSTPAQQKMFKDHPQRTTSFRDGGEIINALTRTETGYDEPDKRRAVDNCRMACLIYLNLIMADNGDFSTATEEFLGSLQQILEDDDDDSSLSAEHLLWTLLSISTTEDHYQRVWKMSRLVGVVKRSSSQMWTTIENALRTFLRLPDCVAELQAVLRGWNSERFLIEATTPIDTSEQWIGQPGQASLAAGMNTTLCSTHCQICPLKPPTY